MQEFMSCVESRTKIRLDRSERILEAESLVDRTLGSRLKYPGLTMVDLAIAVMKKADLARLQSCIGSDIRQCAVPILESLDSGWRIDGTLYSVQIIVPQNQSSKVGVLEQIISVATDESAVLDVEGEHSVEDVHATHDVEVPGGEVLHSNMHTSVLTNNCHKTCRV